MPPETVSQYDQQQRSLAQQYGTQSNCQCPVHRDGEPGTVPLGIQFSERLDVRPIDQADANEIYENHHSYMGETHSANLAHHGVYVDDKLVVAMTYRYPLMSKFKVYTGPNGAVYRDDSRASREGATKHIVAGDELIEINRICVAVGMQNLASAAMSASVNYFLEHTGAEYEPSFLITYIREDHSGSMLKALQDDSPHVGLHTWQTAGTSVPRTSGNREETEINQWEKQRWIQETRYSTLRQ